MTNRKRTTKPKTIGKLPPDLILPVTVKSLDDLVEKISRDAFKSAQDFFQGEGRSFICDMLLPDGTRSRRRLQECR